MRNEINNQSNRVNNLLNISGENTSDIIDKEVIKQLREEVLQDIKRNLRIEVMSSLIDNKNNNNNNDSNS